MNLNAIKETFPLPGTVGPSEFLDLVQALVQQKKAGLAEAMHLAEKLCDRCRKAVAHDLGLNWGVWEYSDKYKYSVSRCAYCEPLTPPAPKVVEKPVTFESGPLNVTIGEFVTMTGVEKSEGVTLHPDLLLAEAINAAVEAGIITLDTSALTESVPVGDTVELDKPVEAVEVLPSKEHPLELKKSTQPSTDKVSKTKAGTRKVRKTTKR